MPFLVIVARLLLGEPLSVPPPPEEISWIGAAILISLSAFLLLLCGLSAGLGHCVAALHADITHLSVLESSGTPSERRSVRAVHPLLRHHRLVMLSLVLVHAISDEALPLVLERLTASEYVAIAAAVPLVIVFGELAPSLIFEGGARQLRLAATLAPVVWLLVASTAVVTWPLASVINCVSGSAGGGALRKYRRNQLMSFLRLHGARVDRVGRPTARSTEITASNIADDRMDTSLLEDGANSPSATAAPNVAAFGTGMFDGILQAESPRDHAVDHVSKAPEQSRSVLISGAASADSLSESEIALLEGVLSLIVSVPAYRLP